MIFNYSISQINLCISEERYEDIFRTEETQNEKNNHLKAWTIYLEGVKLWFLLSNFSQASGKKDFDLRSVLLEGKMTWNAWAVGHEEYDNHSWFLRKSETMLY